MSLNFRAKFKVLNSGNWSSGDQEYRINGNISSHFKVKQIPIL